MADDKSLGPAEPEGEYDVWESHIGEAESCSMCGFSYVPQEPSLVVQVKDPDEVEDDEKPAKGSVEGSGDVPYDYVQFCRRCTVRIFTFLVLGHLKFLKGKNPTWILSTLPTGMADPMKGEEVKDVN